jgi:DNA-binding GntR family transcriptional regulator
MKILNEIRHLSLSERVYDQLRRFLIRHRLEPGDRINLVDLAEKLEVSQTPLREALTRLTQEGLIVHRRHRGYFVAEVTEEEARHLLEMRQALECFALTLSVPRMTDRDLDEITQAVAAYGRGIDSPDRDRFLYDKRLHLRLALGAGNPVLSKTLEQVLDRMIMKLRVEELPRERGPAALEEHRRILESLRRRDAAAASQLLWEHLERTKQYIVKYLTDRRSTVKRLAQADAAQRSHQL